VRVLTTLRRWLRDSGVLVLQVPNAGSLQARLFGRHWYSLDIPRHLTHWTEATLTSALQRAGFAVVATRRLPWRDSGQALAGSLLPQLDPLIDRERLQGGESARPIVVTILRRAIFLATVWLVTPFVLLEAALGRPATLTILARKTGDVDALPRSDQTNNRPATPI